MLKQPELSWHQINRTIASLGCGIVVGFQRDLARSIEQNEPRLSGDVAVVGKNRPTQHSGPPAA
jgi:hypothetical protein